MVATTATNTIGNIIPRSLAAELFLPRILTKKKSVQDIRALNVSVFFLRHILAHDCDGVAQ